MKYRLFLYHLPFIRPMDFNGQILAERSGLIIESQNAKGQLCYAEIAPLPGFSHESLTQVTAQSLLFLNNKLQDKKPLYPSLKFALDCLAEQQQASDSKIDLDTIPLLQGDNQDLLLQYQKLNQPAKIKLKVGRQSVMQDIVLFNKLCESNQKLSIRCDANQAWTTEQASQFFAGINKAQLDYIEEPTSSHQDNLQLATHHSINLALDETLQNSQFSYQPHPHIKALILKPTLIGSWQRLSAFIKMAEKEHLQVSISSSFESIIGLQQLKFLAQRTACNCSLSLGIDTLKYFQQGLLTDKKQIVSDINKLECLWTNY